MRIEWKLTDGKVRPAVHIKELLYALISGHMVYMLASKVPGKTSMARLRLNHKSCLCCYFPDTGKATGKVK